MSATPSIEPEYDIIVAGGGTCGCIVASRLASADPSLRILILEAGPPTQNQIAHQQPGRFLHHLAPASSTVRYHLSHPTTALANHPRAVPTGHCFGGGSSVNMEMYTRPCARDFDDWEERYGNPGWGSRDLIALMKKAETYQIKENQPTHGYDGPLKVSLGSKFSSVGQDYLATSRKFDSLRNPGDDTVDLNDFATINTYARFPKWIDSETGHRSDVAHNYIYNRDLPNVHVVTAVHVRRLVLDDDDSSDRTYCRVTAVAFSWNRQFLPDADSEIHTVRARKLVVLSAGSFGSPGILERSGIGRKDVLDKIGVPIAVENMNVGENYEDHNIVFAPYKAAADADTLDFVLWNEPEAMNAAADGWKRGEKSMLGSNGIDAGVKLRPAEEELEALGPEYRKQWQEYFAPVPDRHVFIQGVLSVFIGDHTKVQYGKYYTMASMNMYPLARGHVHVTHKDDVSAPLDFRCGYLDNPADITPLIWGYKFQREVARRMSSFRGEVEASHPPFSPASDARIIADADGPIPLDAPKIVYSAEDEEVVEQFVRMAVSTTWHALGTCGMRPRSEGGVVDSKLNVYGLQGVKVCDMSICPSNVGANTYSTAVAVGEKGALIIAQELGIAL